MVKVILFCIFVLVVIVISIFFVRRAMQEVERLASQANLQLERIVKENLEKEESVNKEIK